MNSCGHRVGQTEVVAVVQYLSIHCQLLYVLDVASHFIHTYIHTCMNVCAHLVFTDDIEEKVVPFLAPNVNKVNVEVVGPLVRVGVWWGRGRGVKRYVTFCHHTNTNLYTQPTHGACVTHTHIHTLMCNIQIYMHTLTNTIYGPAFLYWCTAFLRW